MIEHADRNDVGAQGISRELLDAEATPEEQRARWLAARKTGIGGSDAAAACGLSPYKTPYRLWLEKTGQIEDEDISDKPAVKWGLRLEDVVAQEYAERTGETVHRVNRLLRHPMHDFMLGNIDRRVVGKKKGLEIKTAGYWAGHDEAWGAEGSDEVPMQYVVQCQHYMAVTGWDSFDLAALIAGQEFRIYPIPRDEKLIELLITLESDFWRRVQHNVAPDATQLDDVRRRFPQSVKRPIVVTPEVYGHVLDLKAAKEAIKEIEGEVELHKAAIGQFMEEADVLVDDSGNELLTFKNKSTGQRISLKKLAVEHPDVFATLVAEGYITESQTREMRLKG